MIEKNELSFSIIVLIAVAGNDSPIEATLDSLSKCIKPLNYKQTIIVENGPKCGIELLLKKYESTLNLKYLYQPRANKSAALNTALETIEENSLLFMTDDDTTFDKNILLEYNKRIIEIGFGYFFGGKMNVKYEKSPDKVLLPYLPTSSKPWPSKGTNYNALKKFLGMNWAAFSDDLKNAGGFNVNFGPGTTPRRTGQEHKMQEDLIKIGIEPQFVATAKVWHKVPVQKSTKEFALSRQKQFGLMQGLKLSKISFIFELITQMGKVILFYIANFIVQTDTMDMRYLSNYFILKGQVHSLKERKNYER